MRFSGLCLAFLAGGSILAVPTFARADLPAPPNQVNRPLGADHGDPQASNATPSTDAVMLHIDSPRPVELERRQGDVGGWEHVCTSPCDVRVPLFDQYRIGEAEGVNESKPFMIDGANKEVVTLSVNPGTPGKARTGMIVLGVGAVAVVAGVVTIIAATSSSTIFRDDVSTHNTTTNLAFVGSALILGGVAAVVLGGSWMSTNGHSGVGGDVTKAPAATLEKTAKREAIFVTPQASQIAGATPTFLAPIVNARF